MFSIKNNYDTYTKRGEKVKKKFILYFLIFLSILCGVVWSVFPFEQSQDKKRLNVAVLDSGVNSSETNVIHHNILKSQVSNDAYGHGTGVFHVLKKHMEDLETWDNTLIYSVKVMDNKGNVTKDAFIEGMEYAIEQGADLINISFGFNHDDPSVLEVINRATKKGVLIVAAAGNNFGMQSDYPARYENVISVNAYDTSKNRVPRYAAKGKIDFIAPGENIVTRNQFDEKIKVSGSSFATPYITAMAAVYLIKDNSVKPNPKSIISDLSEYASSTEETNNREEYVGAGMPRLEK